MRESTDLAYTDLVGELEHLKIETRLIDKKFPSVMGECVIQMTNQAVFFIFLKDFFIFFKEFGVCHGNVAYLVNLVSTTTIHCHRSALCSACSSKRTYLKASHTSS